MKSIVAGVPAAQTRTCMLGSILAALESLRPRMDVSEAVLLGMGVGMQFRYGHYKKGLADNEPVRPRPDIACFHIELDREGFADVLRCCGVSLTERQHGSPAQMVGAIKADVANGRPVQLILNNRFLDYVPQALRNDAARFVLCHGWDDTTERVWITDSFVPSTPPSMYQGSISRAAFVQALELAPVVGDSTYPTWHFEPVAASTREPDANDLQRSIVRSCESMVSMDSRVYRFGSSRVEFYSGREAVRRLIADLPLESTTIDAQCEVWLREVHALLTTYGGPLTARSLYAEFWSWAERRCLVRDGANLARKIVALGREWETVANVLLKAAVTRDVACVERATTRLLRLLAEEEQVLEAQRVDIGLSSQFGGSNIGPVPEESRECPSTTTRSDVARAKDGLPESSVTE